MNALLRFRARILAAVAGLACLTGGLVGGNALGADDRGQQPVAASRAAVVLEGTNVEFVRSEQGISEYRLPNGLKILLKPDHTGTKVSTYKALFRVGSRNEGPGYTGSTHFLEHLMFKGTPTFSPGKGNGAMDVFVQLGAAINASTSNDYTQYFECLSSEHLETSIRFEADRMRNLLLLQRDKDREMPVVRNEFERYEDDPGAALDTAVGAKAYQVHPYRWMTIGSRADVEAVSTDRLRKFYDQFYWPNNCTVIVVGDFDPTQVLGLIARYYGGIPTSPGPIPPVGQIEPPQTSERRVDVKRPGGLPVVEVTFHTPAARDADTYPLAALSAVLGGSHRSSSRLYKALIDTGLASSCGASSEDSRDPGLFRITATATRSTNFDAVESAIYGELEKLTHDGVSPEELRRAKVANRKGTVLANADQMNFASALAAAEGIADWTWFVEYDNKYDAVTPDGIVRVVKLYFTKTNRTVGRYFPTDEVIAPSSAPASTAAPSTTPAAVPAPATTPAVPAPAPPNSGTATTLAARTVTTVLPNGLTLLVVPLPGSGAVAVQGAVYAGAYFEQPASPRGAAGLTAFMLGRGSRHYSKDEIAGRTQEMSIGLGFSADTFKVSFGGTVVRADLPDYISLVADALRSPTLAPAELVQVKRRFKAFFTSLATDTGARAQNELRQRLYPKGHPFYQEDFNEAAAEIERITTEDLGAFHKRCYSPKSTLLVIVGDVDATAALSLVKGCFADWSGPDRLPITVPDVPLPAVASTRLVPLPNKSNVSIVIGVPSSLTRKSKDFAAAYVASQALGGNTISARLGRRIRDTQGLTYGVYSSFDDAAFGGRLWEVSLTVNPINVEPSMALVHSLLDDYAKNGITDAELKQWVENSIGMFAVGQRSPGGVAQQICQYRFIGMDVKDIDELPARFRAVTKGAVNSAITAYMRTEQAVTAMAGSFAKPAAK